jgi:hypothetical protein
MKHKNALNIEFEYCKISQGYKIREKCRLTLTEGWGRRGQNKRHVEI